MRKFDKVLLFAYLLIIVALIAGIKCTAQEAWKPNPKYIKTRDAAQAHQVKQFQCYGTTQKGERCKRKVSTDKSYCYQHAGQK